VRVAFFNDEFRVGKQIERGFEQFQMKWFFGLDAKLERQRFLIYDVITEQFFSVSVEFVSVLPECCSPICFKIVKSQRGGCEYVVAVYGAIRLYFDVQVSPA